MSDYYDREGRPLDRMEWAKLFEDFSYRMIACDEMPGYRVSTIWLGLDHAFMGGPPQIFETMIFPSDGAEITDWMEDYCRRYSTEAAARAGHDEAMAMARDGKVKADD